MRKLTKIIGVALIATGLMVSVTGCADPNSGLAELQAENEQLKKDKENAETERDKAKKDKEALEAQITKLLGYKESAESLQTELNNLQKELDSLIETSDGKDATIKSLKDQIDAVQEEVAKANNKIAELVGQLSDEQDSNNNLENQIAENESTIQTLNKNIDELTARVTELIAENEQLKEAAAKVTYKVEIGDGITRPLELKDTAPAIYIEDEKYGYLACYKKDVPTADWFEYPTSAADTLSLEIIRDVNNIEPYIVITVVMLDLDD